MKKAQYGWALKIAMYAAIVVLIIAVTVHIMTGKEKPLQKGIKNTNGFIQFVNDTYRGVDEIPYDVAADAIRQAVNTYGGYYETLLSQENKCIWIPPLEGVDLVVDMTEHNRRPAFIVSGILQGTTVGSKAVSLEENAKTCIIAVDFKDGKVDYIAQPQAGQKQSSYLDPQQSVEHLREERRIITDMAIAAKIKNNDQIMYCLPEYYFKDDSLDNVKVSDIQLMVRNEIGDKYNDKKICARP